jgi:hypothetical protein
VPCFCEVRCELGDPCTNIVGIDGLTSRTSLP